MKQKTSSETALTISDAASGKVLNSVEALFLDHSEKLAGMVKIANFVNGKDELINYFISGASSSLSLMAKELFDLEKAKVTLDAEFWSKAIHMTDVLECMSAKKRNEWSAMIHDKSTPSFDRETVITTIRNLLLSRGSFLAEKVDGIFRKLSGEHVTNSPLGFKKRMIISYVLDGFGYINHERSEYLHDLRSVIAKILGRDEPKSYNTRLDLGNIVRSAAFGEWHTFDGGAFKIKIYNKGTAHMEAHPDVAVKLNLILASLYPQAIASGARVVNKVEKTIPLRNDILSYEVSEQLSELVRKFGNGMSVYFSKSDLNQKLINEVEEVLTFLGGSDSNGVWSFTYDVADVLVKIVRTGCLPEKKSHQYYPTGKDLAERVVDLAQITKNDLILEPSAGQGALAELLPKNQTTCVEVSGVNCAILEKKGFNVVTLDFLKWEPKILFSKIVMNPPFAKGAAESHVKKAASLMKKDGKLVAILPASLRNKTIVGGMTHNWSEVIPNGFDDTNVNVVILELQNDA
jgi:hypothetical protein